MLCFSHHNKENYIMFLNLKVQVKWTSSWRNITTKLFQIEIEKSSQIIQTETLVYVLAPLKIFQDQSDLESSCTKWSGKN